MEHPIDQALRAGQTTGRPRRNRYRQEPDLIACPKKPPTALAGGNPASWSRSAEAWFHLLLPLLPALLHRRRGRRWIAAPSRPALK
ncbi:hypothetical protein [Actinacidiphila sp. bgisy160]|uniref:hypothetical protein n=1 Tax=Actinacidiphila sp. bgisy160 TaxID=3413796 RepID=UPI003D70B84D